MREEKRLFLALAVSMGILLLWSALVPAPKLEGTSVSTGPHPGEPSATLSSGPARIGLSEEPVFNSSLGPFSLAVGTIRGGIKSLAVDGARILVESSPGILQVDATQPGQGPGVQIDSGIDQLNSQTDLRAWNRTGQYMLAVIPNQRSGVVAVLPRARSTHDISYSTGQPAS